MRGINTGRIGTLIAVFAAAFLVCEPLMAAGIRGFSYSPSYSTSSSSSPARHVRSISNSSRYNFRVYSASRPRVIGHTSGPNTSTHWRTHGTQRSGTRPRVESIRINYRPSNMAPPAGNYNSRTYTNARHHRPTLSGEVWGQVNCAALKCL